MNMHLRATAALLVAAVLLVGCGTATQHGVGSSAPAYASPVIDTVTHTGDVQVTGSRTASQTILTTPSETYNGSPVEVDFDVQYCNMIPDAASTSNGIGFDLYEDGKMVERMGLFGEHNLTPAMAMPMFAPINLSDVLDGAKTPTAGQHTFSVEVWKWSPNGDGYLRAGDDNAPETVVPKPMRLTVKYF